MRWATLAELRLPDMSCGMQEICQAEVTHPLTVPESRAPTLRQRKPRQIQTKVISFISSCACYPHFVVTFIGALCCELESASSTSNTSLLCVWPHALQVGLVPCGSGRDGGKENLDPAPMSTRPRLPRAKKVRCVVPQPCRGRSSASL